ncbi:uncharacterized protein K444DRAFT_610403 [Hyaloscypha bicolor E]|uniref:Uncharacterized protein n=1 Tax=Hyaloscypha bicolor E TaxID=1095630 RepID=A0A2J6TH16_9HELO|nr:uncharacterized protein K444DRAFT_610403 [Hyaloscypha bicolor E]PMD62326.1 hypothetical protein K444DRAFT_610403 [Hyaloscypha bicolor E]
MSDAGAENGSSAGEGDPDSPPRRSSIGDEDLPNHSATESYVEQEETHERIAIGEGTSDPDEAVGNHCEKMKDEIKDADDKLDGAKS